MFIRNMTTYKCKLKIYRLESETYVSRSENHIFALKSSMNTEKGLGLAQKIGSLGLVETNNFLKPKESYMLIVKKCINIFPLDLK